MAHPSTFGAVDAANAGEMVLLRPYCTLGAGIAMWSCRGDWCTSALCLALHLLPGFAKAEAIQGRYLWHTHNSSLHVGIALNKAAVALGLSAALSWQPAHLPCAGSILSHLSTSAIMQHELIIRGLRRRIQRMWAGRAARSAGAGKMWQPTGSPATSARAGRTFPATSAATWPRSRTMPRGRGTRPTPAPSVILSRLSSRQHELFCVGSIISRQSPLF